jgi:hypothetical protein
MPLSATAPGASPMIWRSYYSSAGPADARQGWRQGTCLRPGVLRAAVASDNQVHRSCDAQEFRPTAPCECGAVTENHGVGGSIPPLGTKTAENSETCRGRHIWRKLLTRPVSAGYTAGERDVIAYCEEQAGRRLTAREIAFQIACAETVLGPGCAG